MTPTDFMMRGFRISALASFLLAVPVHSAGFGIFQQGAKAMGMAGAFTAQADDPSAMFHNVGGLAYQKERAFQLGATFISIGATDFEGVGGMAAGATERSEGQVKIPPHFYWVEPLGERWTFGLAINSPFGLTSEWKDADFSGRFLSRMASLESFDINPNLAWKASETLGFGFGLVARFSEVELFRDLPIFDPAAGAIVDFAEVKMTTDLDMGLGFQLGVSGHPNESWSWGLSYRSSIEIEYSGDGRLVQLPTSNAGLDALLAATVPFGVDLPLTTAIDFPDMASLGLAIRPSSEWLIEFDFNWAGWSSLEAYSIEFSGNPEFATVIPQDWEDVLSYRLGFRRSGGRGREWRFGLSFDETPQPLTTLDPLLPDGDQSAVTLGYGFQNASSHVDLALMYLAVEERTTRVNVNNYNGSYSSSALLFASTVGW